MPGPHKTLRECGTVEYSKLHPDFLYVALKGSIMEGEPLSIPCWLKLPTASVEFLYVEPLSTSFQTSSF